MDVKQLSLTNLGQFSQISIPLAPTQHKPSNITVLVGNNGSGKTSILTSLTIALSWFAARVRNSKSNGSSIPLEHIKNDTSAASIEIDVLDDFKETDKHFHWSLTKTSNGHNGVKKSQLSEVSKLTEHYRSQFSKDKNSPFPLIAYYPAERFVRDISLEIKHHPATNPLDGYEDLFATAVDFKGFFQWYRNREDSENESGTSNQMNEQAAKAVLEAAVAAATTDIDPQTAAKNALAKLSIFKASAQDNQLAAVRSAISIFMPGFANLRVQRSPILQMFVDKNGQTLSVNQLSQGEKSLLALTGDIARRLAMMNPALENPLLGDGIVLIDEADLHLHPKWQRTLATRLGNTFPNCQFVLTTHSPLLISDSKDILCYLLDDGELTEMDQLYGLDANQVLLEVMDTDIRNVEINEQLNLLLDHIQDGQIAQAQRLYDVLCQALPSDHIELMKARLLIRKLELRHAKNQ
jgi:predicted ATP-binding protein involved in virulence